MPLCSASTATYLLTLSSAHTPNTIAPVYAQPRIRAFLQDPVPHKLRRRPQCSPKPRIHYTRTYATKPPVDAAISIQAVHALCRDPRHKLTGVSRISTQAVHALYRDPRHKPTGVSCDIHQSRGCVIPGPAPQTHRWKLQCSPSRGCGVAGASRLKMESLG